MAEDYRRPGWYPDPAGAPGERWWNGSGWSDSRRGAAPAAPVPAAPMPQRPDPYIVPGPVVPPLPRPGIKIDTRQNRPALVGFVLGLIGLFAFNVAGPVAIVFAVIGIARARRLRIEGSPSASTVVIATIGLATGVIATVLLVITVVATIATLTVSLS